MQEFLDSNKQICLGPSQSSSSLQCASNNFIGAIVDKKNSNNVRMHSIGQAFRNSWKKKDTETKPAKKSNSMVIFVCSRLVGFRGVEMRGLGNGSKRVIF